MSNLALCEAVLALAGAPALLCASYLFVLALFANRQRSQSLDRPSSPARSRFDVVIPAHDEEGGIADTVKSVLASDYPAELRRVVVIADNCTDATAERAREAGALVIERRDPERRGKGYALEHAFARLESHAPGDAVVVVDADSVISPNLLADFAGHFERGAQAVQADYGVRNPDASWRTRLMVIALALFHGVRSLGRDRLGLSAGLRGNGMGFTREVLREVPYDSFSLVEDVEYGIKLGRRGHRVEYAPDAHVWGEMVTGEKASRSQRQRWERGRVALARAQVPGLLAEGIRQRSALLLDLAADLLVPPLTTLVMVIAVGVGATLLWSRAMHRSPLAAVPWLAAALFVCFYLVRGWLLSGTRVRGFFALASAPVYIFWKLGLLLRRSANEWVRTARGGERR